MKKVINKQLWINQEEGLYTLGVTNAGQDDFGSIAFITLPKVGEVLNAGETFAELEAEKAVTELVTPITGKVASINQEALADASVLDAKNENFAWIIKLSDVDEKEFVNLV